MKILFSIFTLLLSLSILSGCATIFSGSREEISLESEPAGATVLVNGEEQGTTPMVINAKKGRKYKIQFLKEGYVTEHLKLLYSIGAGWLVLDIFTGILGIAIDAGTGNWNIFENDNYKVVLKKEVVKSGN